jgi:hypothetical protein
MLCNNDFYEEKKGEKINQEKINLKKKKRTKKKRDKAFLSIGLVIWSIISCVVDFFLRFGTYLILVSVLTVPSNILTFIVPIAMVFFFLQNLTIFFTFASYV